MGQKVALVIEKPKCCGECMLSGYVNILELDKDIEDRKTFCKLTLGKCLYNEKLDNCPLKSLPERKEPRVRMGSADSIYEMYDDDADVGWNACVDTLEKYAAIQEEEIKKEKERSMNKVWISMKKQ